MINYDKLFNIAIQSSTPCLGSLLISEPFLREEHFAHSVICLIDYGDGVNPMGVVLNRPSSYTLDQLIEGVESERSVRVWAGGPVATDRLYFLHTLGNIIPHSREIVPGLYLGGDFDAALSYINAGYPVNGKIRFFVGYSGWSQEQLQQEIDSHVWAVTTIDTPERLLSGGNDSLWHRYVRRLGHDFRNWLYHPRNPHLN